MVRRYGVQSRLILKLVYSMDWKLYMEFRLTLMLFLYMSQIPPPLPSSCGVEMALYPGGHEWIVKKFLSCSQSHVSCQGKDVNIFVYTISSLKSNCFVYYCSTINHSILAIKGDQHTFNGGSVSTAFNWAQIVTIHIAIAMIVVWMHPIDQWYYFKKLILTSSGSSVWSWL